MAVCVLAEDRFAMRCHVLLWLSIRTKDRGTRNGVYVLYQSRRDHVC